jgi:hypothetical protein
MLNRCICNKVNNDVLENDNSHQTMRIKNYAKSALNKAWCAFQVMRFDT